MLYVILLFLHLEHSALSFRILIPNWHPHQCSSPITILLYLLLQLYSSKGLLPPHHSDQTFYWFIIIYVSAAKRDPNWKQDSIVQMLYKYLGMVIARKKGVFLPSVGPNPSEDIAVVVLTCVSRSKPCVLLLFNSTCQHVWKNNYPIH